MRKPTETIDFFVEPSAYGWTVREDDTQLGLFATQRQAINSVKKRQAELTAMSKESRVVVTGHESEADAARATRHGWKSGRHYHSR